MVSLGLAPVQRFFSRLLEQAAVFPLWQTRVGALPPVTPNQLREYYLQDPDTYAAINYLTNRSTMDIFVSGDEKYKNGKAIEVAKDFIDHVQWGERRAERGLKSLSYYIYQEMLWSGSAVVEMLEPNALKSLHRLQASSLQKWMPTKSGSLDHIRVLLAGGETYDISADRISTFTFNKVDYSPFGYPLIYPLAVTRTDIYGKPVPSLLMIKRQHEQDFRRFLHRYGSPRTIFNIPGAKSDDVDKYSEQLKDPEADASFATNFQKMEIVQDQGEARGMGQAQRLTTVVDYFYRLTQTGLQTPINMLVSDPGRFSEASARVSAELSDVIIDHMHSEFGDNAKYEWLDRIIEEAGYDPIEADLKLQFGEAETQEVLVADLIQLATLSTTRESAGLTPLISVEEMRNLLRNSGIELEQEVPEAPIPPDAGPQLELPTMDEPTPTPEAPMPMDEVKEMLRKARIAPAVEFEIE